MSGIQKGLKYLLAEEMAQLVAKHDDPSSITGAHIVKGESSDLHPCMIRHAYTYT